MVNEIRRIYSHFLYILFLFPVCVYNVYMFRERQEKRESLRLLNGLSHPMIPECELILKRASFLGLKSRSVFSRS
jgi:hypothetical protein